MNRMRFEPWGFDKLLCEFSPLNYIYIPGRPTGNQKVKPKMADMGLFWTSFSHPYAVTLGVSLRWSAESYY